MPRLPISDIPEWLRRAMSKPIRVIAFKADQIRKFCWYHRIPAKDVRRIKLVHDCNGLSAAMPILILPGVAINMDDLDLPLLFNSSWKARGGKLIHVPESVLRGEPWPAEINLVASTYVQMAKQREKPPRVIA